MNNEIEELIKIKKLRDEQKSFNEISELTGYSVRTIEYNCSNNCAVLKQRIRKLLEKEEYEKYVISLIKENFNINQVCLKLGIKPVNNNYKKIREIIEKYNVDISHFVYCQRTDGKKKYNSIEEYFTKNSALGSYRIKNIILKYNIKPHKCEECGRSEWEHKGNIIPIPLELHHINGDRTDNTLDNLQLLCSNCHSLTDNFCKRKNGIGESKKYIVKRNRTSYEKQCKCGKVFKTSNKNQQFCCNKCASENSRKIKVDINTLLNDFKELGSFVAVSKKYNVSDKAISKTFKKNGLPYKANELKEYIKNNIN